MAVAAGISEDEFAKLSTEDGAFSKLDEIATAKGLWYQPLLPPDGAVDKLKVALGEELARPESTSMLTAYGGEPRCFERFLIARQNDVIAAAEMFKATAAWRRENKLHEGSQVPAHCCSQVWYDNLKPLWPGAFAGFTTDGSPLNYFRFGQLSPRQMVTQVPDCELQFTGYYIQWMESTLAAQNEKNPPGTASAAWKGMVEVYDFNGLSLSQLYLPGIMMLGRVLGIGQNHYPENGRKIIMVNVPRIMSASWALLSPVLHENTLAKIEMMRVDGNERLLELVGTQEAVDAMRKSVAHEETQSWGDWGASFFT